MDSCAMSLFQHLVHMEGLRRAVVLLTGGGCKISVALHWAAQTAFGSTDGHLSCTCPGGRGDRRRLLRQLLMSPRQKFECCKYCLVNSAIAVWWTHTHMHHISFHSLLGRFSSARESKAVVWLVAWQTEASRSVVWTLASHRLLPLLGPFQ